MYSAHHPPSLFDVGLSASVDSVHVDSVVVELVQLASESVSTGISFGAFLGWFLDFFKVGVLDRCIITPPLERNGYSCASM